MSNKPLGGARKGAGRKKLEIDKQAYTIKLTPAVHARIKHWAKENDMSLSAYIEQVMDRSTKRSDKLEKAK